MVLFNKLIFKLINKVNFIIKLYPNLNYFIFKHYSKAFNL